MTVFLKTLQKSKEAEFAVLHRQVVEMHAEDFRRYRQIANCYFVHIIHISVGAIWHGEDACLGSGDFCKNMNNL